MALITCPTCGREISSNAVSCPHCGEPIKIEKTRTLTLNRPKKFGASTNVFEVYLDGRCIGRLENGGTLKCEISKESHTLYPVSTLVIAEGKIKSVSVTIPAGTSPIIYELMQKAGFFTNSIYFERR